MKYINNNLNKVKDDYLTKEHLKSEIDNLLGEINGYDIILKSLDKTSSIYQIVFNNYAIERQRKIEVLQILTSKIEYKTDFIEILSSTTKQK